jgi:hypothetical protein
VRSRRVRRDWQNQAPPPPEQREPIEVAPEPDPPGDETEPEEDFNPDGDNDNEVGKPPPPPNRRGKKYVPKTTQTRSGRRPKLSNQFFADEWANYQDPTTLHKQKVPKSALNEQYLNALDWHLAIDMIRSNDLKSMLAVVDQNADVDHGTVEWTHPMILGAKANSADNPDWHSHEWTRQGRILESM